MPESAGATEAFVLLLDLDELARIQEQVRLQAVLARVEVGVAASPGQQLLVPATLDDAASLDDEDRVGSPDRRQPVGDDEGRAPLHQLGEALLDQGLALAVERGGGLVEDQDSRVGQDRAGDRDPLALAAGELDAPLADDRVVALRQLLDELVAVGDAGRPEDLLPRGVGPRVGDVLEDRTVEEEVVLEDDADLRAVVGQADLREVPPVHENGARGGPVEGRHQADDRALPDAGRTDQRGRRSRQGE